MRDSTTMKCTLVLMALMCAYAKQALAERIALFDSNGVATAYIFTEEDMAIYTWKGQPVAYLVNGSVWGINGKHLGWFANGIIRDHSGYVVGCIRFAMPMSYKPWPPIQPKKPLPPRRPRKRLPPRKSDKNKWSTVPFSHFLAAGRK